ncbi:MAG: ribonuclease D [Rhodospirillaceae bacterium]|jgi:ribonuclease D|nr:ribonuclease D [Rhodospirillaceae bacterium]MBT6205888.1 ribonuclease D [Rhodospirillaceae bacterium]MBT6509312.1 ribonuclease D [Rhodospirillaceae bacterium]MBT7614860.1 ribonuclease D [Rhodospirillaceae bacterium]MBT7647921.1 ribonuclease D [Rhodospirillaceae bacterium]
MTVITNSAEVAAFCDRLKSNRFVTIDTEFMRERTYWSQLCLIQLAGENENAAIDPLAEGIDLFPVFELMADPSILKVFHAARQDLEIFFKLMDEVPHPVFDTQVAAMVCGFGDQIGYEAIVRKIAGKQVDKDSRFTDWSRRPLSEKQVTYALADVTHLRTVYESLAATLEQNGRTAWIEEEMKVLTSAGTYRVEFDQVWQRMKIKGRKPRQMAVLREIAAWREETAQRKDVPRNRVIKDDALVQIALQQPKSSEELGAIRLVPQGIARSEDGKNMMAAVARAMALPDSELPKRELNGRPPVDAPVALVDLMKTLLRAKCKMEGVAPRLVANMADIERFAAEDDPDGPLMQGWRHDVFGRDGQRLKAGRLALAPDGEGLKLIEI